MAEAATTPFVNAVPDYEIRDGNMHISADGWSMCMSLRTFRAGMAKAARVLAEYDATGEVVPIKRRRGG